MAAHPTSHSAAAGSRTEHPPATELNGMPCRGDDPLIELIVRRRFMGHGEYDRHSHAYGNMHAGEAAPSKGPAPVDFLFLTDEDDYLPDDVFDRLRWGGQVVLASTRRNAVQAAARAYETWRMEESDHAAWQLEHALGHERRYFFNLRILGFRTPIYFMVARKIMLVPPGKSSDRFTYHVQLEKPARGGGYEVVKEVPTVERVVARLREKFPDADVETLRRRARKFTDKIFPVFLTRETAMLKLLQRDLPRRFRNRVPQVISAETDANGYTRLLRMNWLRNAMPIPRGGREGHALSQLEFARQAAELLAALHDDVGIIHLDLRLDNVVITEQGVSFVDFGSAVRVGEEFPEASLLGNLFDEMMRTSQIQRMLGKMTQRGEVTSEEILSSHHRVDKAVDFFYLAVQINAPLSNPDFRSLVEHNPKGEEARELARLTDEILRPENPESSKYTSARQILRGIEDIREKLAR